MFLHGDQTRREENFYTINHNADAGSVCGDLRRAINKFVRPRWPYDMRPSVRAEKYIRDAGP